MPRNAAPKNKIIKTHMIAKPLNDLLSGYKNISVDNKEKAKQSRYAIDCLIRLGAQQGTIQDWMFVHYRICTGLYVAQHYFKYNPELEEVLAAGLDGLSAMILRAHVKSHFAILMNELDNVTEALNVTSVLLDEAITLAEMKIVNKEVEKYYDRIIAKNMESYPSEELERIQMVKTLAQEKRVANYVPKKHEGVMNGT